MSHVIVVGGGVAGTAAALAAARAGARVTLFDGGTGASTLATGAIDAVPWQAAPAAPIPIEPTTREFLSMLDGYLLPDAGAKLLTTSGVVRTARGYDAALLDIGQMAGKPIAVVGCDRPGWDARELARAWDEQFVVVDAVLFRHVDERALPDADFASRHDDDNRVHWLSERLREALSRTIGGVAALVLPPCLGVDKARARELSDLVGVRCGEAIASPGGPAGLRFERARDRALAKANVERLGRRVAAIIRNDEGWAISMEDAPEARADAVVVATGGLIGGGIEYAPSESIVASALPPFPRRMFRPTIDMPVALGANGVELDVPSTLFGSAPESIAWPFVRDALMDRVGVLSDANGKAGSGIFAAGDLLADRPRAWLDVFATGIAAGAAAARSVPKA